MSEDFAWKMSSVVGRRRDVAVDFVAIVQIY